MELIKVSFEGKTEEFPKGTSYLEISKHSKLKDTVLGVKKNNEILSLDSKAMNDEALEFFDARSTFGAPIYKAAIKFIFEVALKTIYNNADIHYLHSVPKGMLGEIISDKVFTNEDISKIKEEMMKIILNDYPFKRYNILKKELEDFYEKSGYSEKASNIEVYDYILTIYKLKDYLNYYYVNMPYSTKYIKNFDLKYLGNNRLIFLYPTDLTDGKVPEYVHHENIIDAFYKGQDWLKRLNTPYVSDLNNLVSTNKIKGFMESCELYFNDQIRIACEEIIRTNERKFIMIAGPSSSGKTTTTRVLGSYLRSKGYDPICLSTDDYFVERENNPKDSNGNYDFECLQAVDIELLNSQLLSLLKGEEVNVPMFNFITGKKEYHNHYIKLKENSIILIEGLHSLNSDLTPSIPERYKYKIYLSPFIPLNIDRHNYISTLDLRLIRRIVRDNRTRGHDVSSTLRSWESVRSGEERYIFPYVHQANIVINTALPYEVGVLKVFAEPLLLSVKTDSVYYEEARRLLKFLRGFYSISSELVDKNSILREFIGGNND